MGEKMYFLLMGKTGEGKSATGNFLLGRETFTTSDNVSSETKKVEYSFATYDDLTLVVVDGPGLQDTHKTSYEDKKSAARNMSMALAMCDCGIDSFILVLRYGSRFTAEDRCTLETLKQIFGPKYMDHVIVVLTHGDNFESRNKNNKVKISIQEWCEKQERDFHQLYIDCNKRFVLFNNYEENPEKSRAQIEGLVKLAQEIKRNKGRYTNQCFEYAKRKREKMIVEAHAPELKSEIQEKVSLFSADIEKYVKAPTDTEIIRIREDIMNLKETIEKEDDGHGVLHDILQLVEQVSENLDNFDELHFLAKELEETRKSTSKWTFLDVVCVVAGGVLCLLAAPVVVVAGVVALGAGAIAGAGVGAAVAVAEGGKFVKDMVKEKLPQKILDKF